MKIRSNFVANSSSSSSVFITTETEHNRVLGLLTEFEKAVVEKYVSQNELEGLKLYYFKEYHDSSDCHTYQYETIDEFKDLMIDDEYLEETDSSTISEIVNKYQNLVDKKKRLYLQQDC